MEADGLWLIAREMDRLVELRRVFAALETAQIPSLVYKGSALAFLDYPEPWRRDRHDTDILIRDCDIQLIKRIFEQLGYEKLLSSDEGVLSNQFAMLKGEHVFDVHWRLSNRPLFRDLFSFTELQARSREIASIQKGVQTLSTVDAFIVACLHPVMHHHGQEHDDWTEDLFWLLKKFEQNDFEQLGSEIRSKKISGIVRRGVERVQAKFKLEIPQEFLTALQAIDYSNEPTYKFALAATSDLRVAWLDFWAWPTWGKRVRYISRHFFPADEYMKARFSRPWMRGPARVQWLSRHFYRWGRGATRYFKASR
jgi:hypothetical protein